MAPQGDLEKGQRAWWSWPWSRDVHPEPFCFGGMAVLSLQDRPGSQPGCEVTTSCRWRPRPNVCEGRFLHLCCYTVRPGLQGVKADPAPCNSRFAPGIPGTGETSRRDSRDCFAAAKEPHRLRVRVASASWFRRFPARDSGGRRGGDGGSSQPPGMKLSASCLDFTRVVQASGESEKCSCRTDSSHHSLPGDTGEVTLPPCPLACIHL